MNRRAWLRSSLIAAGSVSLMPKMGNSMPFAKQTSQSVIWEVDHPSYYGMPPEITAKLNANENPYGPASGVKKAISEAVGLGNRYGHGDAAILIDMIAKKEGVTKDHIMLGPGSTDLLEKTAITRFLHGGNIVSADPSYMSLINTAQAIGADWKAVPLTSDYAHDLPAMEAAIDSKTQLVYVCNPNNPTGSLTAGDKLRDFCSRVSTKVPIFIDEAYLDFLDDYAANTMVGLVADGKDVIVARTFSKIYGMAGLRIGYIVATPKRIESITSMVRSTMGLCVTSLKGAIASLQDDGFCAECKDLNTAAREYVCSELGQLGYKYIPSFTNFVLFPMKKDTDTRKFMRGMTEKGVGIRVFNIKNEPWCRVSIGTMPEMQLFTQAFKEVTA